MNVLKKVSAILLVVVMLVGLCACGGKTNNNDLEGNTYVAGFPIVKNKETIEVMTFNTVYHGDFDEMGFTEYYEDLTNMDIEWLLASSDAGELDSKLTLMFQSNDLPDVITLPSNQLGSDRVLEYSKTGQIIALDELIDKYAPNIKAMFEKYPEAKKASTAVDGKIYSLPSVNMASENHERFPQKIYIRKSWLENLGLEVPTTAEEFYEVLKAFKNNDPNGNGEQDEIPFATNGISPSFFGSWGSSFNYNNGILAVDDNGKVSYGYANEGAKQALAFFNRLYSTSLCENYDSSSKWQTKLKNGVVGVFYHSAAFTVIGEELADDYIMMAPFAGSEGVEPVMSVAGNIDPNHFIITNACENPIAAIRWVDYFYSTEGYYLTTYGRDGDVVTKNKDGKWEWAGERKSETDRFKHTPGYVLPYCVDDDIMNQFVKKAESELTSIEKQEAQLNADVIDTYLGKYEPQNLIWMPALDDQALKVINQYSDGIEEYAAKSIYEFAVGIRNIDTEWDAYMAEINKKGLPLVLAEYQRLYDNAQAKE